MIIDKLPDRKMHRVLNFANSFILTVLFIFGFDVMVAQEIEWQKTVGGFDHDLMTDLKPTLDGGFICASTSKSGFSGDKTKANWDPTLQTSDWWIVKFDSVGNIQWQNSFGGTNNDFLQSISETFDGGYICGGYSASGMSGDKTENNVGSNDIWVIKLDSSGNIVWQNTIGGISGELLYSIQQTADSGFICAGSSASGVSGDKTESSFGNLDYWVLKLDINGNIEWQKTIGGSERDVLNSILQTDDGGYICGGSSRSGISGNKSVDNWDPSLTYYDYWIVKLNQSGNIMWQAAIGGNENDLFEDIKLTNDHGYICIGTSTSDISGVKTENSIGGNDIWVLKLDSLGTIQWQNTIGGLANFYVPDPINSIQPTIDGGYLISSSSNSPIFGDKTESNINPGSNTNDYWIIKIDSTGNILWQNVLGGNAEDASCAIHSLSQGGIIVGGYSWSDISGDKTENFKGGYDFWILKCNTNNNSISGKLFIDSDFDGICDSSETVLINKKIIETNSGRFCFSQQGGTYNLSVTDTGTFQISPSDSSNYFNLLPAYHTAYFNGNSQTDSLNDFAFQPLANFDDLCITIQPQGPFRPGFDASYRIQYSNHGTTTQIPIVVFYPDANSSFLSATEQTSSITPDSVVFILPPLSPLDERNFVIKVNIHQGLSIGTIINGTASIFPIINDANPSCNESSWQQAVTGSYDPNDIQVDRKILFDFEIASEPWLEYLIRFQNVGNDTAFHVKIINPVALNSLQINSLELVCASHPVELTWVPWENNLEFRFENILLPDSSVNELMSHGFVRYRIKSKSNLLFGDTIKNFAAIYFDFNLPVITNTAITEIVLPTLTNNYGLYNSLVYPNPFLNEITVALEVSSNEITLIELKNIYGQQVKVLFSGVVKSGYLSNKFDLSDLSLGIYLLTITGKESTTQKIIKH